MTDKQFVKNYIEESDPVEQLSMISKMLNNEEFDVDRNFLTKTIHVRPNKVNDPIKKLIFTQIGLNYGFSDGDSALYVLNNKWQKVTVPVKQLGPQTGDQNNQFPENFKISYDQSALKIFYSESDMAYWDMLNNAIDPKYLAFGNPAFSSIAGIDGDHPVYFLNDALGAFSEKKDTLSIVKYKPKFTGNKKDALFKIALPAGVIDYQSYGKGVLLHTYHDNKHSLYYYDNYNQSLRTQIPDSLLNSVVSGPDFKWEVSNGLIVIYSANLLVFSQESKFQTKIIKIDGTHSFSNLPSILGYTNEMLWLGLSNDGNSYSIIKVNRKTNHKPAKNGVTDSLTVFDVPNFEPDFDGNLISNVNQDGLILAYGNHTLGNMNFFKCKNSETKIEPFDIRSMVDSNVVKNLANFEITIPQSTPKFEFTATSLFGIGVTYQIIPKDKGFADIIPIQDNSIDNPKALTWPIRSFFDVESVPDYFFMVLLIIGVIILYFFGLFYVLDFNNRDSNIPKITLPDTDKLVTLTEKLNYTKNSMQSLKLRSEIMLWLGLVIGVAGMFAFVYSLKTFFSDTSSLKFSAEFTVRMLRTFAIFSFMEVFSFYFLKQYRITFNEYKRFYSLYLRIMNYFEYVELAKNYPDGKPDGINMKDMRDAILKDYVNMHDESNLEKVNEFEKSVASDIVKTLASKIPSA